MIDGIADLVDNLLFLFFADRFSGARENRKLLPARAAAFAALFLNIVLFERSDSYVVLLLADCIVVMAYSFYALKGKPIQHFVGFLLFYAAAFVSAALTNYILAGFDGGFYPELYDETYHVGERLASLALNKLLLCTILFLLLRIRNVFGFEKDKKLFAAYVALPSVLFYVCLQLFVHQNKMRLSGAEAQKFTALILLLLASFFATLYLSAHAVRAEQEKRERERLQASAEQSRGQLDFILGYTEENRRLRHDLENEMILIRSLAARQETSAALDEMEKIITRFCGSFQPEPVIYPWISVIEYKKRTAGERGIDLQVEIVAGDYSGIADMDLGIILGNLLDNAIRAAEAARENSLPAVTLYLCMESGLFYLSMENPYTESGSTETPPGRGLGLQNVERIVAQYQGQLTVRRENLVFYTEILMYPKE